MDPFDEFEFKPLTEGLGFNKKPATLKDQVKSSGLIEEHFESLPTSAPRAADEFLPKKPLSFDDVIKSLEKAPLKQTSPNKGFLDITEPLPRSKPASQKSQPTMSNPFAGIPAPGTTVQPRKATGTETPRAPVQSPFPSQDIFRQPPPALKKTPPVKEQAKVATRRGAADSPQRRLVPTHASLPAAALDLLVVSALTMIFMAALLATTKADLNVVIHGVNTESWTRISLGDSCSSPIMQMYVVISRSFFGCTVGEWTFDVQLGKNEDQLDAFYPVKVIARSLIVTITGLVLLPLVSLVMGEDVAGLVSGTQLYEQK